ncbi:hypothetical protein PVK06_024734 [Gossypium arboreum]|uniref:Uncharacterized protein n=1 Tax=Gossypium arboreum TaxID=29729 RepID=A0ABR0PEI5_GOSAR|nr:hypothetical protein PVK06_024734 [Gossypium arboreum]
MRSDCSKIFSKLILKEIINDQNINENSYVDHSIDQLWQNTGVFGSLWYVQSYVKKVVHKFYANLNRGIVIETSDYYYKVFIYGGWYKFGPKQNKKVLNYPLPTILSLKILKQYSYCIDQSSPYLA